MTPPLNDGLIFRRDRDAYAMSYWWNVCQDCPRRRSFGEARPAPSADGGHVQDGALLLAALDLAEHQGATGHWRGLLWTGAAAADREPEPAEIGVCAEHPAYVVPQMGGRWLWTPKPAPRSCALMPRMFDLHGDGSDVVRGYPLAIPAWLDSRHRMGSSITVFAERNDHTHVCRPCACLGFGPKIHGDVRPDTA